MLLQFFIDSSLYDLNEVVQLSVTYPDQNGFLKKTAYTIDGRGYEIHPQGFVFEGHRVAGYNSVIKIIKEEAKKLLISG